MIMSIFNLAGSLIALPLMERCGRRPLMLFGLIGCLICDLVFMAFSLWQQYNYQEGRVWPSYVCLVAILVHVVVYNLGPGSIPWFISSELTPQSVRSIGASVSITVNWFASLMANVAYLPLQEAVGAWSFLLFIAPSVICAVFLWLKMPETKNRTVDEIMATWSRKIDIAVDRDDLTCLNAGEEVE
jgi:SP family facilitated glucose transporter-like MFS transporter 1